MAIVHIRFQPRDQTFQKGIVWQAVCRGARRRTGAMNIRANVSPTFVSLLDYDRSHHEHSSPRQQEQNAAILHIINTTGGGCEETRRQICDAKRSTCRMLDLLTHLS
jgi:hypothetical protein